MALQPQIEQVAAAFDRQDYKTAAQLLKRLIQDAPDNPSVQLYVARLQEVSGKADAAEAGYRKLLQQTASAKIALHARQGLHRLEEAVKARRKAAIAEATADPTNSGLGFLVLEALAPEAKQMAIQHFARIMKLDPYTARIHLSHRGWKLYRTGPIGELQIYGRELQTAGIPVFWVPLTTLQQTHVFRVQSMEATPSQATVICQNQDNQMGSLTFNWAEVSNRVEGMLPIFEEVVYVGAWNQLKRKEQTQDYAKVLDLHLPNRRSILRFCDTTYQLPTNPTETHPSASPIKGVQATNRQRWNRFVQLMGDRLPTIPLWSAFTPFAETALEHLELAGRFPSHIDLCRKQETVWDKAFHLYSELIFNRPSKLANH